MRAEPGLQLRAVPLARFSAAPALGLLIGAVTSVGQAHLNLPWSALVNSASPWLLGGFVAGAVQVRRTFGLAAGLVACIAEVVGYYVVTAGRGYPVNHSEIVFWTACAVIGGPLFGWAGWAWCRGPVPLRPWAAALPPATFLAEAVGTYELRLHYHSTVVLYVVIGLVAGVLVTTVSPSVRRRLGMFGAALAGAFVVGLLIYWQLLTAVAGSHFNA